MKLLLTLRIAAALFLEDLPPQEPDAAGTYVCRTNIEAPAGFDYMHTQQVLAGDIVAAYEDMCPEAIERFNRGEGVYREIPR